jgi:hypothetical protein
MYLGHILCYLVRHHVLHMHFKLLDLFIVLSFLLFVVIILGLMLLRY